MPARGRWPAVDGAALGAAYAMSKEVEICVRLLFIVWCGLEVARNAVTIVKMLDKVSTFFVPKVTSSSGKKKLHYTMCKEV